LRCSFPSRWFVLRVPCVVTSTYIAASASCAGSCLVPLPFTCSPCFASFRKPCMRIRPCAVQNCEAPTSDIWFSGLCPAHIADRCTHIADMRHSPRVVSVTPGCSGQLYSIAGREFCAKHARFFIKRCVVCGKISQKNVKAPHKKRYYCVSHKGNIPATAEYAVRAVLKWFSQNSALPLDYKQDVITGVKQMFVFQELEECKGVSEFPASKTIYTYGMENMYL